MSALLLALLRPAFLQRALLRFSPAQSLQPQDRLQQPPVADRPVHHSSSPFFVFALESATQSASQHCDESTAHSALRPPLLNGHPFVLRSTLVLRLIQRKPVSCTLCVTANPFTTIHTLSPPADRHPLLFTHSRQTHRSQSAGPHGFTGFHSTQWKLLSTSVCSSRLPPIRSHHHIHTTVLLHRVIEDLDDAHDAIHPQHAACLYRTYP